MRPLRLGREDLPALIPGLVVIGLMLLWAAHDGGFDADTWYWGALVTLALLGVVLSLQGFARPRRASVAAIGVFALYVAWSYLSITWAQAPGVALEGSNRALLYLLVFSVLSLLPWSRQSAKLALVAFALGLGTIAIVLLVRLASTGDGAALILVGRLRPPTGYFNGNTALFTMGALVMLGLSLRRELPGPLRGLLLAMTAAGLQLAVVAQSRGWLFTLPIVALAAIVISTSRLRLIAALVLPVAAVLIPVGKLLAIYGAAPGSQLTHAVHAAGRPALALVAVVFVLGTVLAWTDGLAAKVRLSAGHRMGVGIAVAAMIATGVVAGGFAATRGHPFAYISRQWRGFSHTQTFNKASHFSDVGSGRYDFWRVSLDAFLAHPVGGLGQDNFADYYVRRRRTPEEPAWTHSLEMRLLAHTGAVGFVLFALFLALALMPAVRARRRGPPGTRAIAGVALMPLVVWLVQGSIDWFWELPALAGPALGFLGMAGALSAPSAETAEVRPAPQRPLAVRVAVAAAAVLALTAATLVLTLPYLSVREVSIASDEQLSNPTSALHDLKLAAELSPLNANAPTVAGLIALSSGRSAVARDRFAQAIARERGAWLPWLGEGLSYSALGQRRRADRALREAYSINDLQPPIKVALARVFSAHPLTYAEAVPLFTIVK